ncbi:MAG: glycosyltransferase family 39 protein [Cytophagales bacterium]|nr:glycosyltransferase family 39 protein [Cytophaga sp.]
MNVLSDTSYRTDRILIILISALLFIPFIGTVHLFDWDEINFAEASREMLMTGDYTHVQINYETFWEKPPFFFWLQVLCMKVFGVNEFASRLPNALTGIATMLALYAMGRKLENRKFAWIWMLVYAGSVLPHFYFRTGIIDPVFNLFIFASIWFVYRLALLDADQSKERMRFALYAGFFSGMAVLTKGPVGLLDVLLTVGVYMIVKKKFWVLNIKEWLLFFLAVAIVSIAWFGYELVTNGPFFLQEFIIYQIRLFKTQDAGHGGPFYYHVLVILFGCFPMSYFSFLGLKNNADDTEQRKAFRLWAIVSFLVVLVLFSIVRTKIVHYSSFCYFPLSYLAAAGVERLLNRSNTLNRWLVLALWITGIIIGIALTAFPILMHVYGNKMGKVTPFIKDPFAAANFMAPVYWSGWEALAGLAYLMIFICAMYYLKKEIVKGIVLLFLSTILFHETVLPLFLPKIETNIQGEVVDFYESLKGEDAYVEVYDFKSYAHLFYTDKKPFTNQQSKDLDWLMNGKVDKSVYLVTKVDRGEGLAIHPNFERIGGKYGYVFYKRKVASY